MGGFIVLPQPLRWCLGLQSDRFNNDAISVWDDHPVCEFLQTPFVPHHSLLADDGFHPGEQGYHLWAKAVAECITII
ncbi:hypothetical protein A9Q99_19610 [Gammaproteobacteria bacterium 45_16_T64]|nr:hypothetical protein A9Q99_19610 [Gammaproteobacteria bacterium 45_16_T64]